MNMGERDDVETIRLGRKAFDGRRAIANLLVEYLELFSHAVLFAFGGYPSTAFAPVNYCDVIVHKCTDKEVQTYVDTCMRTVHRWLQYAKLSKFSAAIRDENDETVVEYMVIVSRAFYTGAKRIDEFDILASELKNRLRRSILQIQCSAGEADSVNNDQKVRLVLNVQLHKHTSVKKHRPMEYIWEERMVVPECKVMKPYGERIVSKLVQLSILRYAGEHAEDEYEDIDSNRLMHR